MPASLETIVFGGGCFWCTEAAFSMLRGVLKVTPGYAGGTVKNPTYEQVCSGSTGHAEVVSVEFDPSQITLEDLLEAFFLVHDPTTPNRQGNDVGEQYRSVILFTSEKQQKAILRFLPTVAKNYSSPLVTEVKRLDAFYPAEKEHLDYYARNRNAPYCRFVIDPKLQKLKKRLPGNQLNV